MRAGSSGFCPQHYVNWTWCQRLVTPTFRRLRQEDQKFKLSRWEHGFTQVSRPWVLYRMALKPTENSLMEARRKFGNGSLDVILFPWTFCLLAVRRTKRFRIGSTSHDRAHESRTGSASSVAWVPGRAPVLCLPDNAVYDKKPLSVMDVHCLFLSL